MSLLNVSVNPGQVLIGVDTNIGSAGEIGVLAEASKLLVLPHAGVAFACRGRTLALVQLFGNTFAFKVPRDGYDWVCSWLTEYGEEGMKAIAEALKDPVANDGLEIAVAGWSLSSQRMEATVFHWFGSKQRSTRVSPWHVGYPADWTAATVPPLNTPQAMLEAANHQVEHALRANPQEVIGGRLLILRLERDAQVLSRHALCNDAPPAKVRREHSPR